MELHPAATAAVESVLSATFGASQRIVTDPTDATLVPLVLLSWAYWQRVAPQLDEARDAAVALGILGRVALGVGLVATTAWLTMVVVLWLGVVAGRRPSPATSDPCCGRDGPRSRQLRYGAAGRRIDRPGGTWTSR
jgi:hypothetical protein